MDRHLDRAIKKLQPPVDAINFLTNQAADMGRVATLEWLRDVNLIDEKCLEVLLVMTQVRVNLNDQSNNIKVLSSEWAIDDMEKTLAKNFKVSLKKLLKKIA